MNALEARQLMEFVKHTVPPQRGTLDGELQFVYSRVENTIKDIEGGGTNKGLFWSISIVPQGDSKVVEDLIYHLRNEDGYVVDNIGNVLNINWSV